VLQDLELTPDQEAAARAQVPEAQRAALEKLLASTAAKYKRVPLEELGLAAAPRERQEHDLREMVNDGRLFAFFRFDGDPVARFEGNLAYDSNNQTDNDLREWYANATTRVVRKARIAKAEIDPNTAKHIQESARFEALKVTATGEEAGVKAEEIANKWAPVAFVYLLWIAVFTAAQMLLTNTVEEKSSRIIEVLLSSASPGQIMHGKIWGIGATGLTIIGSWVVFALLGVWLTPMLVPSLGQFALLDVVGDPLYLASFVAYFLGGYLLFAAILVALGSVCNSLKEAQNLMQPVLVLLMIPIFAMIPIVQEPNGVMAKVFTYIPLYTPFAMMNRASGPPAGWEYAVTTVMIVVSVLFAFKAAGKIFRIGVLMTGNPPKLKEILGWLREK
jgi:ABC-type Na+ efflux pump permease subunit